MQEMRVVFRPPPNLKVSQWAEQKRRLSRASPVPGKWHNSTTPYLVDIMDWKNDPNFHTGVFMKASRIGATEGVINMIGYHVDLDPIDMIYAQTSSDEAQKFAKKLFNPAVESTPILNEKIADTKRRNRDSSTTLLKQFAGGSLSIVGSSSAKPFRMVAVPFAMGDDIDGMPDDVDGEGDPIELLISRTKNFWNRKVFLSSTTTVKGLSRIDNWFQKSDKRYFFLPCQNPDCDLHTVTETDGGFRLVWSMVDYKQTPKNPFIRCPECGKKHFDSTHKRKMLLGGKWRATQETNGIAGFHLSRLYSPFIPWAEMVEDWQKVQGKPKELKVFINHALAEPWEEDDVIEMDYEILYNRRREHYPKSKEGTTIIPRGVCSITAGVDVQHDRFEIEVVGWGLNGETWSIGYHRIPADTQLQQSFEEKLDPLWSRTYQHESGINLRIVAVAVDSGDGARTHQVYKYCSDRFERNIFAIKGRQGASVPLAGNPSKQKIKGQFESGKEKIVNMYSIGIDTAKHEIFGQLKIDKVGAGYQHFPHHYTIEYFKMLTAERAVMRKKNGRLVRVFEQTRDRNEALDCRVYAMGALEICGVDLEQSKQEIEGEVKNQKNNGGIDTTKRNKRRGRTLSKGIQI
jgi:phage terminase large subunit GpA-like protein